MAVTGYRSGWKWSDSFFSNGGGKGNFESAIRNYDCHRYWKKTTAPLDATSTTSFLLNLRLLYLVIYLFIYLSGALFRKRSETNA